MHQGLNLSQLFANAAIFTGLCGILMWFIRRLINGMASDIKDLKCNKVDINICKVRMDESKNERTMLRQGLDEMRRDIKDILGAVGTRIHDKQSEREGR